jgi:RND family efflux transporter MFP subunit
MSIVKQIVVCVLLLAAATAGWLTYNNPEMVGLAREIAQTGQGAGSPGGTSGAGNRIPGLTGRGGAVNVITAPVEVDEGGETSLALGTAKAVRSVTLFPEVTGVVAEVMFTPGQPVKEGAVLVRLDDAEQRVAVDRARVTLEQARQTLERNQKLAKSKNVTVVALQEAELAAQLAEIEQRTAEIALQRMRLTAPFDGMTGLTDISVGDLVTTTTQITTLDDLATMRVTFEVPERWAGRIAQDQPIIASAQALPGSEFPGRISGIDSRVDTATRTLRLEADLANQSGALKTGMAVAVTLAFEGAEQLAVPTLSVQWDRRGSYVWKVVDGAAIRAAVAILRRESGVVIVQGEVAAGDRVVAEGIQRLRQGIKVVDVDAGAAVAGDPPQGNVPPAGDAAPAPAAAPAVSARQPGQVRS